MSSVKIIKELPVAPGVTLRIKRDEAEPLDSINAWINEVVATGEGDAFTVPPHWHKLHTERITVVEGRANITVNGEIVLLSAGDPTLSVPRRVVHGIQGFKGERLVIREQADPAGDYKVMFFNDLLSDGGFKNIPHTLRAFYDGDAYLALPLYFRFFDEVFITVFGGIARLFASPKAKTL